MTGCCVPEPPAVARPVGEPAPTSERGPRPPLVIVPGGTFLMGSEDELAYSEEGPVRAVELAPFAISATAVTNAEFAAFVAASGHESDAERFGWSFVFGGLLPDDFPPTQGVVHAPWWRVVEGASWRTPEGPHSTLSGRGDHPVVHVSQRDAEAFCRWTGTRLPTEAEWERAARAGLSQQNYPWGGEREPGGTHRMNVWQGRFPAENTSDDGWYGTCPVGTYPPNGFGLFNMCGNTWEWTSSLFDPYRDDLYALRGGSYLCHESYCMRYRVSARVGNTADTTLGHTGFRVAADAPAA